jgi:hypothetical protein
MSLAQYAAAGAKEAQSASRRHSTQRPVRESQTLPRMHWLGKLVQLGAHWLK